MAKLRSADRVVSNNCDGNMRMTKIPDLNLNDESDVALFEEGGSNCKREALGKGECKGVDVENEGMVVDVENTSEDCKHKYEGKRGPEDSVSDFEKAFKSDSGALTETHEKVNVTDGSKGKTDKDDQSDRLTKEGKEGRIQLLSKVLRSRIVLANELGEEAGGGKIRTSPSKRKRGTNGDVVDLSSVQRESKTEDDGATDMSQKKKKRGRPKKSLDHPEDHLVLVKDEDMDDRSILILKQNRRGKEISIHRSEEVDAVVCKGEDEAGEVKESVGSAIQRRKSERKRETNEEVLELNNARHESKAEDAGANNNSIRSSQKKRGRPKKKHGRSKMSLDHHGDQPVQVKDEDVDDRSILSLKRGGHGEEMSLYCSKEDNEVVCNGEDEAEELKESVGSATQRHKSESKTETNGEVLELNNAQHESKAEDAGANDISIRSSQKKRGRPKKKRGRCKISLDHHADQPVPVKNDHVDDRSILNLKRGRHGEEISFYCSKEDNEVVCNVQDEAEKLKESVGSATQRRKSERKRETNGEVVELLNVQHESKAEDDGANIMSIRSAQKKNRGNPTNSIDHPKDQQVQVNVDDMDDRSIQNLKEGRHGEQTSLCRSKEDDKVPCNGNDETGEIGKKSTKSETQKRKSGRPKRLVDYCEKVVVQRGEILGCIMDDGHEDEDEGQSNVKAAISTIKGWRGRPRKQQGSNQVMSVSYEKDTNVKEIYSAKNKTPSGLVTDIGMKEISSSKCEETSLAEKNLSVEPKRGKTAGSLASEKNLIRNQIIDMLLHAGWTIERRPRNGRDYLDFVYVNRAGKTHWSVTKAYVSLQKEFKGGNTGNSDISFTPLPDEVLSRLFRVSSKTRSDKSKKRHKTDGDSSVQEVARHKHKRKKGVKSKHCGFKRKRSVRDGTQSKRRCALVVRRSKGLDSQSSEAIAHSGKDSILAWLIGCGGVPLHGKVQYMNRCTSGTMFEGRITRDGIFCNCCKTIFSVFEFEKHTGSKPGHPYENLHLEGGQPLIQCLLDSWNKQDAGTLKGFHSVNVDADDPNDDTCAICGDGGDLMCCDGCPSTFHHDCLNMEDIPLGEWHCVYCSCKFCGEAETHMINHLDPTSSSLSTCCLCEEKYHLSCAVDGNVVDSGRATFCGKNCEQTSELLQTLIGIKSDLGDGFSWTLLQRFDVKGEADSLEVQKIENNSKLAVALSVMNECFMPIIDPRSGINLIPHVVYNSGSNLRRLNSRSFFTIVLEKGDEVISAASIRIHSKQLAEMPFIGTRNAYRRQGMCRRLLTAIELALGSLNIEHLIIPAIPELLDTWTKVFGFQPLEESIREEMRLMNMLVFAHTDMLQKPLLKPDLVDKRIATIVEDDENCSKSSKELLDGGVEKSEVDDGCFNDSFDLNIVTPSIPESSSEERLTGYNAGDCGVVAESRMDSVGSDDTAKVEEALLTPIQLTDNKVPNSSLPMDTSDGSMIPNHPEPSCNNKGFVRPCSANVGPDEAAKTAIDVIDPNNETACVKNAAGIHEPSIPTGVSLNGPMVTAAESNKLPETDSQIGCPSILLVEQI